MDRRADRLMAGFTLVELLVVIGVIGVLLGLVFPTLATIRSESKSSMCLSNLRQLFMAVETARVQNNDLLPFAAPLPLPPGQIAVVADLPRKLNAIIPVESETWMCPADDSLDSQTIGASYLYLPGAFMMLEPPVLPDGPGVPVPTLASRSNADRVSRLVTQRFSAGYLNTLPILVDSDEYHVIGDRLPRNAVFLGGEARPLAPGDGKVRPPASSTGSTSGW